MTALVIIITIIGVFIALASMIQDRKPTVYGPFTSLMQEERSITRDAIQANKNWKKVVYIQYKDNILMLKYKDYSFIEYTHHSNKPYAWKKRLNKNKFVTDQQTINQLDEYYLMALNGKREGGGWVKSLR